MGADQHQQKQAHCSLLHPYSRSPVHIVRSLCVLAVEMATTACMRLQPAVACRAQISNRQSHSNRRWKCLRASAAPYKAYSQVIDRYLMLFLVQQDLGVQLQRAMNSERYDLVQEVQKRKAEVRSCLGMSQGDLQQDTGVQHTTHCGRLPVPRIAAIHAQNHQHSTHQMYGLSVHDCDRRHSAVRTLARQRALRKHRRPKQPTAPARPTPAMAKPIAAVYIHARVVHSTTTSHEPGYTAVHLVCSTHKLSMPANGSRPLLAQHFGPADREGDGEPTH